MDVNATTTEAVQVTLDVGDNLETVHRRLASAEADSVTELVLEEILCTQQTVDLLFRSKAAQQREVT